MHVASACAERGACVCSGLLVLLPGQHALDLREPLAQRVTRELVSDWARFTRGPVDSRGARKPGASAAFAYRHVELEGAAHLVLTQPAHKTAWLRAVADALETVPRNA